MNLMYLTRKKDPRKVTFSAVNLWVPQGTDLIIPCGYTNSLGCRWNDLEEVTQGGSEQKLRGREQSFNRPHARDIYRPGEYFIIKFAISQGKHVTQE